MKALSSHSAGGPDTLVLDERPAPLPGRDEVTIAVRACGINYPDVLIIEDRYQLRPERPFSPGCEVAGMIDTVGAAVSDLKPGDRVMAYSGWGGLAQTAVVRADRCTPIPASLPFDQAAALQITYGTALHALEERAGLREAETLLVLGASGGVGLAAIQLGKALGARVVAATSSPDKSAVAAAHGADSTLVYPSEPRDRKALAKLFKDACGGTADVVFDPVGGEYCEPALRTLAWQGRYLVVGFAAGVPSIPMNLPLLKGCQICGVFWGQSIERSAASYGAQMRRLLELHRTGRIRPEVSARFPLARGAEAIACLAERRAVGKVVVTIPE